MSAREEIEKLKKEFLSLQTEEERIELAAKFKNVVASKSEIEKEEFAGAFMASANEAVEHATQVCDYIDVRLKLSEISEAVSMSYISKKYFKKSKAWFSQRLNGHKVNGNPATFNKNELEILSSALFDISGKINETARSLT
jgi:hypothetical protein